MDSFNKLADVLLAEAKKEKSKIHEFVETRKKGAEKIQKAAQAKGGPAKLTAIHFAAKEKPYKEALSICDDKDAEKLLKKKMTPLITKLQSWNTMSQNEFQTVMGKIEAYGEIYIKLKKPNSLN